MNETKTTIALSDFLSDASCSEIIEFLTDGLVSTKEGHAVMNALFLHKPRMAEDVLCRMYDVACYQVGDSCFKENAPVHDHRKWFVSTLASSSLDSTNIPLAESEAQAQTMAVAQLGLRSLFFLKEEFLAG